MKRILNDWLHWGGNGWHIGWHRYGKCWRFKFSKSSFSTCTFYEFWRFFLAFDKTSPGDGKMKWQARVRAHGTARKFTTAPSPHPQDPPTVSSGKANGI